MGRSASSTTSWRSAALAAGLLLAGASPASAQISAGTVDAHIVDPASGNAAAVGPTGAVQVNPGVSRVIPTDGTTPVTVKPPFVAPSAGDSAQVVVLSPVVPATIQGAPNAPPVPISFPDTAVTGVLTTAGSAVMIDARGRTSATVRSVVVGTNTITFEGTTDNVTFTALNVYPVPSGASVTTSAATGLWWVNVAGQLYFRVRVSAFTSGSATVTIEGSRGEAIVTVVQPTAANLNATVTGNLTGSQSVNLAQIAATTIVNGGLAGSQSVGGTAANNAAINQNPVLAGAETVATGGNAAAATGGNQRRLLSDVTGALFVRRDSSNLWSCALGGLGATLTQCQAAPAAGLVAYVTDITVDTTTGTAGTWQISYGTGSNCGTGTTTLYPNFVGGWTAPVLGAPQFIALHTPLVPAAANAICVIGTVTNTINVQLQGFIAP